MFHFQVKFRGSKKKSGISQFKKKMHFSQPLSMEKGSQSKKKIKCPWDKDHLNSMTVETFVKTSERFKDYLIELLNI